MGTGCTIWGTGTVGIANVVAGTGIGAHKVVIVEVHVGRHALVGRGGGFDNF